VSSSAADAQRATQVTPRACAPGAMPRRYIQRTQAHAYLITSEMVQCSAQAVMRRSAMRRCAGERRKPSPEGELLHAKEARRLRGREHAPNAQNVPRYVSRNIPQCAVVVAQAEKRRPEWRR